MRHNAHHVGTRVVVPLVLFVVAFLVRLIPLLDGAGWYPVDNYDPSVYYAAAVGLFEGRLPYRDFLLLHPPGLLVFLQPFAALGAVVGDPVANLVARLAFMVLGSVTVVLIYRLLLGRGLAPALLGAGFYLSYFPALYVERTTRLEGLASALVVVGLVVLAPVVRRGQLTWWRAGIAGALFGLGVTVKIWGIVLVAALVAWLLVADRIRTAAAAAGGAVVGMAAVLVPFQLAAPQMWNMVVLDQLGRPRSDLTIMDRLLALVGLGELRFSPPPDWVIWTLAGVVVVFAAFALADRMGRFFVLLFVTALATLLIGPSWYSHYPEFAAVPLALVLGTGLAQMVGAGRRSLHSAVAAATAVVVAVGAVVQFATPEGSPFAVREVTAVVRDRAGCITTDNPVSLILTNTLRRNLRQGCPLVVDLSGYIYNITRTADADPLRSDNPAFQRELMNYLASGNTAIIMRLWPDSFSAQSQAEVRSWPSLGVFDGHHIRQPIPRGAR